MAAASPFSPGAPLGAAFDTYRASANAALQWLVGQQEWRERVLKLEQRRVERDREALQGAIESLRTARDWTDFAIATQSVWREYVGACTSLWQEGAAAAMQGASMWSDTARDVTQQWQQACAGAQAGAANGPGALPMREWMAAFERAMNSATNGAAYPASSSGAGRAQGANAGGGQHGH